MALRPSTGKLTDEQIKAQDERYAQNHEYDYVIIGSGSSSLTVASLLANAGKKVCILEAHDIAGGYMQSFKFGDYHFCAQVHYTWGCGPEGKIYSFLEKLGLEKDIEWELYDPEGYDHMIMPDGKRVKIPYGWDKLVESVEDAYPGQRAPMEKFVQIMDGVRRELGKFPSSKPKWWEYPIKAWQFPYLIRFRKSTMQDVFDKCGLSKEAQAVLIANAGDMMAPPEELSIFSYAGLFGGYNTGAYYPKKHFKYYVDRLVKFITDHEGCHIYYESRVIKINTEAEKVTSVETEDGKVFTADKIICNMDPQVAAKMIGWDKFPADFKKPLEYEYSPSGMVLYLGLKDIKLEDYGMGKHNTWHLLQWDMNKMWQEQLAGNFTQPWFFMSTPTLHSKEPGTAPEGHEILEIATLTDFDSFDELAKKDKREYRKKKRELADHLIDLVEKYHIPNLREHINTRVVGTTTTNEEFCLATRGNAYGSHMNPEQMGMKRLKAFTPWDNFFWCNASSGYAGVYGTVHTGMQLYMDLTGDVFYDSSKGPTDDELIADVHKRLGSK
ncbi:MAG: NAD(P)/FAD-dependent oxidoreductase [bacterium]|nr:NAD(P)/FAD-dependent oxidoreductase [bacterium]